MHHQLTSEATGPAFGGTGQGCPSPWLVIATGHHLSLALVERATLHARHHEALARGHAEALMPALRALLAGQPRPAAIIVETGPGSFTGLRIGIAAARALGLAWHLPVRGVSSMLLVAAAAAARGHQGPLRVALAAPRGQVWLQRFDGLAAAAPARSLPPEAARIELALTGPPITGSGIMGAPEAAPDAAAARHIPPALFGGPDPLYLSPSPALAA
jgi:tRNA threonylcarbamoyl adenosine modification protein YeaZ